MRNGLLTLVFAGLLACGDKADPGPGDSAAPEDTGPDGDDTGEDDCEDPQLWYRDADSDGYGEDVTATPACDPGEGWSLLGGDCDDTDHDINPDGQEVCDGFGADEDCDGLVDDADDSTAYDEASQRWYVDWDGDGHAADDDSEGRHFCEEPEEGYLAEPGGDCDDAEEAIHPGAPETCWDLVDEDCDGSLACELDGSTRSIEEVGVEVVGSVAAVGARAGSQVVVGDVDGDGVDEVVLGSSEALGGAGVVWWLPETPVEDVTLQDVSHKVTSTGVEDALATSLSLAGDLDGDGATDLLVGAPAEQDASDGSGAAYLLSGPLTGEASVWDARSTYLGPQTGARLGDWVARLDDLDSDGVNDVFTGAPEAGSGFVFAGVLTGSVSVDEASLVVEGSTGLGCVATGVDDLDGDGVSELLLGDCGGEPGVHIFAPGDEGSLSTGDALGSWLLSGDGDGLRLATGSDLDGDGLSELILGQPGEAVVFVLAGVPTGSADAREHAWARLSGVDPADALGSSLLAPGDLDGDGPDDLLLGATGADGAATDGGAVYLLQGPLSGGSYGVADRSALLIEGSAAEHGVGAAMGVGRVLGSELDLVLGAPGDNGAFAGGRVGAARILLDLGG